MTRPMRRNAVAAAALAGALLAAHAFADRESAQFYAGRADKALAAKKWDEAETHYRKALDEDAAYLPARFGLAQALVGSGRSAPAIDELRALVDAAKAAEGVAPEWKALVAKAEKQLTELDAAGSALAKLNEVYANDLAALAERWLQKDPQVAERALRRAVKVVPGHAKATKLLEKLGKSSSSEVVELFDGKSFAGWEAANQPEWQVLNGVIVGDCRDSTFYMRTHQQWEGDFDVRMEMRVVKEYGSGVVVGLLPCWKAMYDHYRVAYSFGRLTLLEMTDESTSRKIATKSPEEMDKSKRYDPEGWNVLEARCRGGEIRAFVNGEEIGSEPRKENRKGGAVGVLIQNVKVEIRKIQVERR